MKRLKTQKDGRQFAIEALARLAGLEVENASTLNPVPCNAGEPVYREGPQFGGFIEAMKELHRRGTEEAVTGFAAVLTDCLASEQHGANFSREYRRDEQKGMLPDYPETGIATMRRVER
jgi:hypothetical protein